MPWNYVIIYFAIGRKSTTQNYYFDEDKNEECNANIWIRFYIYNLDNTNLHISVLKEEKNVKKGKPSYKL